MRNYMELYKIGTKKKGPFQTFSKRSKRPWPPALGPAVSERQPWRAAPSEAPSVSNGSTVGTVWESPKQTTGRVGCCDPKTAYFLKNMLVKHLFGKLWTQSPKLGSILRNVIELSVRNSLLGVLISALLRQVGHLKTNFWLTDPITSTIFEVFSELVTSWTHGQLSWLKRSAVKSTLERVAEPRRNVKVLAELLARLGLRAYTPALVWRCHLHRNVGVDTKTSKSEGKRLKENMRTEKEASKKTKQNLVDFPSSLFWKHHFFMAPKRFTAPVF